MTNKEAIEVFEKWKGCRDLVFAKNEIECNGSCDNCEFNIEGEHTFDEAVEAAIEALKEKTKPFATVANISVNERPHGEWIYGEDGSGQDGWFCSECKFFVPWYYQYYENDIDFIRDYKVCPHCLAKMVTYTGKNSDVKGGDEK